MRLLALLPCPCRLAVAAEIGQRDGLGFRRRVHQQRAFGAQP
jgi:hypothetical protein